MENTPKLYVGTKIIAASPCSYFKFKELKGIPIKEEDVNQLGYFVHYDDSYQSWSPEEVFERCYRPVADSEMEMVNTFNTTFPK